MEAYLKEPKKDTPLIAANDTTCISVYIFHRAFLKKLKYFKNDKEI